MKFLFQLWHMKAYSKPNYFSKESRELRKETRITKKMIKSMDKERNKMRGTE